MAQIIVPRTTYHGNAESRLERDVSQEILYLYPEASPLLTLLSKINRKRPTDTPKFEWFETDYVARWGVCGSTTIDALTTVTTITVTDGTQFVAGDVCVVPLAIGVSTQPEQFRVTSVSGNALTVSRAINGASLVNTIAPAAAIRILGPAYEENSSRPAPKMVAPTAKAAYTQIFRTTWSFSGTAMNTKHFGSPGGEYEREKFAKAREHKLAMNAQFLWGAATETLAATTIRTSAGLNSVITTNVTDAGTTLTEAKFREWSRQMFTAGGGSNEKILLAAPIVADAVNTWATAKQQMKASEEVYGLKVSRVEMGSLSFAMVVDKMLENGSTTNGFAGWAFAIDPNSLELRVLANRDTKYIEYDQRNQNGVDGMIGEYMTEIGLQIQQEKWNGKLYNVAAFS